ncbi:unnamed protein product, partial [Staurois parvus]
MLLPSPESLMGPCTASHCCCLHRHTLLPCATFRCPHTPAGFHFVIGCWQITGSPIAAARPLMCHGPLYRLLTAAARSTVCHGSLYRLPLLLSPSPHSAMCHFQVSSHSCWIPFC